jgi:hypothetical protein
MAMFLVNLIFVASYYSISLSNYFQQPHENSPYYFSTKHHGQPFIIISSISLNT